MPGTEQGTGGNLNKLPETAGTAWSRNRQDPEPQEPEPTGTEPNRNRTDEEPNRTGTEPQEPNRGNDVVECFSSSVLVCERMPDSLRAAKVQFSIMPE